MYIHMYICNMYMIYTCRQAGFAHMCAADIIVYIYTYI